MQSWELCGGFLDISSDFGIYLPHNWHTCKTKQTESTETTMLSFLTIFKISLSSPPKTCVNISKAKVY